MPAPYNAYNSWLHENIDDLCDRFIKQGKYIKEAGIASLTLYNNSVLFRRWCQKEYDLIFPINE